MLRCRHLGEAPRPDVLVSAGGDVVAVRGADGRLAAVKFGSDTLSIAEWLAADGDDRAANARGVAAGFACDPDGCIAKLADGAAVAVTRSPAGFADDCARAALIVTLRVPPPDCAAHVLDRTALRRGGATALTWRDGVFAVTPARPGGLDRPWARSREAPRAAGGTTPGDTTPNAGPDNKPDDATPLAPDIDAEP
jgi:competence protein ComEC